MKKKKKTNRVYIWILGLFALGVIIFFISEPWNFVSIATSQQQARPVLPTHIKPPYLRLVAAPGLYNIGQTIPVDIYVHTNGQPTIETIVMARYDPTRISLVKTDITNTGVYPVINVESVSDGSVVFSLFTDAALGYPLVSVSGEKPVAHLEFRALAPTTEGTVIELILNKNGNDSSGIYIARTTPDEAPQNILDQAGNATIRIEDL